MLSLIDFLTLKNVHQQLKLSFLYEGVTLLTEDQFSAYLVIKQLQKDLKVPRDVSLSLLWTSSLIPPVTWEFISCENK